MATAAAAIPILGAVPNRRPAVAMGCVMGVIAPVGRVSASAKSAAVRKRSAGDLANALVTTCSSSAGTVSRTTRRLGTGSSALFARMAWGVDARYAGSPPSIS